MKNNRFDGVREDFRKQDRAELKSARHIGERHRNLSVRGRNQGLDLEHQYTRKQVKAPRS